MTIYSIRPLEPAPVRLNEGWVYKEDDLFWSTGEPGSEVLKHLPFQVGQQLYPGFQIIGVKAVQQSGIEFHHMKGSGYIEKIPQTPEDIYDAVARYADQWNQRHPSSPYDPDQWVVILTLEPIEPIKR